MCVCVCVCITICLFHYLEFEQRMVIRSKYFFIICPMVLPVTSANIHNDGLSGARYVHFKQYKN